MLDLLVCAIRERRVVRFTYDGEMRTAEPYILGFDSAGHLILSAVQLSGGSGAGFRTYRVDGLSHLLVADETFTTNHPDYNPRDRLFERVLAQV